MSSESVRIVDTAQDGFAAASLPSTSTSSTRSLLAAECTQGTKSNERTILRIKRRTCEDPAQALLLSFKRWKGEENMSTAGSENSKSTTTGNQLLNVNVEGDGTSDADVVNRVLRFAGTVNSNESESKLNETITQALNTAAHEEPLTDLKPSGLKRRLVNSKIESRADFYGPIFDNRFRLVNKKREPSDLKEGQSLSALMQDVYSMYDVVQEPLAKKWKENNEPLESGAITCNGVPLIKEKAHDAGGEVKDSNYVYDLYVSSNGAISEAFHYGPEFDVSIVNLDEDDLFLETYRNRLSHQDNSDANSGEESDDDSNDESNWRNDYPDSDPGNVKADKSYFGTGETEELGSHIGQLNIDGSSSDDDYYSPSPNTAYIRYKQRVLGEIEGPSNEVVSLSEESD